MRKLRRFHCEDCHKPIGCWEGTGRIPRRLKEDGVYKNIEIEIVQKGRTRCKRCSRRNK